MLLQTSFTIIVIACYVSFSREARAMPMLKMRFRIR